MPARPPQSTTSLHAQTQGGAERRKHPRKFTNLKGSCFRLEAHEERISMVVENLSVTGCRIRLQHDCELKRGEVIRVEFKLDDVHSTLIRLKGEVRWALSDLAGMEFVSPVGVPHSLTNYVSS